MHLIKYLSCYLRFPYYRDFLKMGLGIEARKIRCEAFWRQHLEKCKSFQSRCLATDPIGGAVSVLGSGRLYDINTALLTERFRILNLFDADPGAQSAAKQLAAKVGKANIVNFILSDISGTLGAWTEKLRFFLATESKGNISALETFLGELQVLSGRSFKGSSAVLSVNLLGQIPLFWRDRFHRMLNEYWKIDTDDNGRYAGRLQEELEATMGRLQAQHLQMLADSAASLIILIADTEYKYSNSANPGYTETERALFLYQDIGLPGYNCGLRDSWEWEIAPQGIEQNEFGIVHQVAAYEFRAL